MALTNDDILVVQSNDDGELYKLSIAQLSDNISPDTEIPTGETPPSDAIDGSLWFNTEDGRLYVYYDDGNTEQWVDASPDTFNPNAVPDNDNPNYQPGTIDDRYVRLNGPAAPQEITGTGGLSVEGLVEANGGVKVTGGESIPITSGITLTDDSLYLTLKNGDGQFYIEKDTGTVFNSSQKGAVRYYATGSYVPDSSTDDATGYSFYRGIATGSTCNNFIGFNSTLDITASNQGTIAGDATAFMAGTSWDRKGTRAIGFKSMLSTVNPNTYNFFAEYGAPNFFKGNTYIGGTTARNTRQLWEETLTEEQKEQLSAGTLAIPANVSTPGDGSFIRQWWYDQQSAEDQALIDSGELEYPERYQAENFVDTFDLGDNTAIDLLSTGEAHFAGNVGIGTSSPSAKLTVSDGVLFFDNTTKDNPIVMNVPASTANYISWERDRTRVGYFGLPGSGDAISITNEIDDGAISLVTKGGGQSLWVRGDGNVGIGTTTPSSKLQIDSSVFDPGTTAADKTLLLSSGLGPAGEGAYGASLAFNRIASSAGDQPRAAIAIKEYTGNYEQCGLTFFTHPTASVSDPMVEQMCIKHDGNVGIGTTVPQVKLDITAFGSDYHPAIELTNTGGFGSTIRSKRGLSLEADYPNNSGFDQSEIVFKTDNVQRMVIDSKGDVGIGITSPSAKLDIVKSTTIDDITSGRQIRIGNGVDLNYSGYLGYLRTTAGGWGLFLEALDDGNAGNVLLAPSGGKIGMGTVNPEEKLHVEGNIRASGTISPNAFSLRMESDDPAAYQTTYSVDDEGNSVETTTYSGTTEDLLSIIKDLRARITELESNTLQPLYATLADLPSASDHHGKVAHVHSEGALYFAHAGSWVKLQNA